MPWTRCSPRRWRPRQPIARRGSRAAAPARPAPSPRPVLVMPELRKDPLLGRWVIIATERVRRPADFHTERPARRGGPCVLCGGHERETPPEVLVYRDKPEDGGWRVRVVPRRFPALRGEGGLQRPGPRLHDLMNRVRAHEDAVEHPRPPASPP